jgi:hypothetical protein
MADQVALLTHKDAVFDDAVVYATGNAYMGCEFNRCVFVFKGFPTYFHTCKFDGCVWHIDLVIHDLEQFKIVFEFLQNVIGSSVPRLTADSPSLPTEGSPPAGASS